MSETRFTKNINQYHDGLAEFLSEAMKWYREQNR
ncbi:TipAS antibiotic-recognition domain-containing protein [Halalkalibacterium ligniniphilum]|nr:TipAS antibiotic-recognition domain-containing protein [Halalkalibacterium ligniniphilum]